MIEKYFKCTLLSNIVINSKLATEGNMTTLDYIPGSNFLGIVAGKIYQNEKVSSSEKYEIFHSGEVSFGDARISEDGEFFYPMPFAFMMEKGKTMIGKDQLFLQHLLHEKNIPVDEEGFKVQLKQQRTGFISSNGKIISNVKKGFILKSAQDKSTRRSKEGAMFGFEYIKKGQEFIFSVRFKDEQYVQQVADALTGRKRIGKSKSAEFGQVEIKPIGRPKTINTSDAPKTLIYAVSNLCFFDKKTGQPTFQPEPDQLGAEGTINWKRSQIRTYSYSHWNGKRNTTDSQRHCILAGSVFVINGKFSNELAAVGAFQSEGLGRIIINPGFLKGDDQTAKSLFRFVTTDNDKQPAAHADPINPTTILGVFLKKKQDESERQLQLSKAVQKAFKGAKTNKSFGKVTSTQWGAIRKYAAKSKNMTDLEKSLLSDTTGYLKHGVAYEKIWSKNNERPIQELTEIFVQAKTHNGLATTFIGKFAGEMAKHTQNKKSL